MTTAKCRLWMAIGVCAVLVTGAPRTGAQTQTSSSEPLARELGRLLTEANLDSIAAKDPAAADEFVAALFFAGQQLLVVSAKYKVPSILERRIADGEFRDVYIDLQSASIPESKVFITDFNADGLKVRRNESDGLDSAELSSKSITFDPNWRRQQRMSEPDFDKAYADADARYTRMLEVLLAGIKSRTSS